MKILEQSQHRLVLELRPVGMMILCLGLFLLLFVIGFGSRLILPWVGGLFGVPWSAALANGPYAMGSGLIGYASVIPLLIGVLLIKNRRLEFNRAAGEVTIATKGQLGRGEKRYPLAAFQRASLSVDSDGEGTTYRALLHFSDQSGVVPVTPYGTGGSGPSRTVNAINGWFGSGAATGSGPGVVLSGPQAADAIAALQKLGIKIPR